MSVPAGEVRPVNALAMIPVGLIDPTPGNPRDRLEDLDELAASIRSVGLLQPLVVQRNGPVRYRVRMGHRRLAASKLVGLPEVLCFIAAPADKSRFLVEALTENGQRRGLNPVEVANTLHALLEVHSDRADLARIVGHSITWVNRHLQLLDLDDSTQALVRRGTLSVNQALATAVKVRRDQGSRAGRPIGAKTKPPSPHHFGVGHPLALAAAEACDRAGHVKKGRLGMVACGACWEQAVRADERSSLALGEGAA